MKKITVCAGILILLIPALSYSYDYRDQFNQNSAGSINSPYSQYQYSASGVNNPYNNQYSQYTPDNVNNPYNKYEMQSGMDSLNDPFTKRANRFNAEMEAKSAKKKQAQEAKQRAIDAMVAKFLKPKATYPALFYALLFLFTIIASGLTVYLVAGIFKKGH